MNNRLGIALIVVSAGGLSALYAWEHWPRHQVTASLGALPTPSIMAAGKDVDAPPVVSTATPPPVSLAPKPALHRKDAEFDRLIATGTPFALSTAYGLALDCLVQDDILRSPLHVQQNLDAPNACGLSSGRWQDRELRKRLITARVVRADFGAYGQLTAERPNGRFGAFTDDPGAYEKLLAEAREIGLAKNEPSLLAGEATALYLKGEVLRTQGKLDEANSAYRQAYTYAVASALGVGVQRGQPMQEALNRDSLVTTLSKKVPAADRAESIKQGETMAQTWKDRS